MNTVAVRTELSAELPKIMADRVQLQQVFMNLMLNAIEAMKDSGGELRVMSKLQDGQLQFSVSDTGVGLPMENMHQIFSAFFTTKAQGSGMGLSISRSIVESHGGRLWATTNGHLHCSQVKLPHDCGKPKGGYVGHRIRRGCLVLKFPLGVSRSLENETSGPTTTSY